MKSYANDLPNINLEELEKHHKEVIEVVKKEGERVIENSNSGRNAVMAQQRDVSGDFYVLLDQSLAESKAARETVETVVEKIDKSMGKMRLLLAFLATTNFFTLLLLILTLYGVYK